MSWLRRRWQWWLAALAVIAGVSLAVTLSSGSSLTARDARWQQDIAFVARTLPKVHVDGLAGANRSGWYSAATRLEAQVPHLTDGQVTVGLLRLVARLHDDETVLAVPFARFFPFGASWVGRHLCLLTVTSSDRSLLGAELMSVDGHPMSEVLAARSG